MATVTNKSVNLASLINKVISIGNKWDIGNWDSWLHWDMTDVTGNKAIHTGSVINKSRTQAGLLVQDATFLVSEASGTVGEPYGISNKTLHTASVTNRPIA